MMKQLKHWVSPEMAVAFALAGAAVLLQILTNGRYGYFRDELYFLDAGNHLAWGYVDFPPLIALIAHLTRATLGDSLHAIRFLPALAHGTEIVLTGLITRELGGRRLAVLLACICVFLAPVIVGNATRLSMNPFEPLFWMGCVYFLLAAKNRGDARLLVWCGVLLGAGLENKHSTIFFIAALLAGLLATSDRKFFASKWFWIGVALAFVIFLPNFIWQYQHGFPTLEDLRNVKATHKNIELPPIPFLRQQIMMLNPFNALVWIAGLGFLLFHREGKRYRTLGITYLAFLAVMMYLKGKDYYLAPIYPMLFAAGGVAWEKLIEPRPRLRWVKVVLPAFLAILGIVLLPLTVPILPVEQVPRYMEALGIKSSRTEAHSGGRLPQYFGDEFGWPEMVAAVAKVYHSLPAEEQTRTAILAGNYGEAGAIDLFGANYGLPQAISAHQNYYYWGPRQYTGETLIMLQWPLDHAQKWCTSVQEGPTMDAYWGMSDEQYTILICRGLKMPLAEAWPHFKVWN
jgi:hypothetical protein